MNKARTSASFTRGIFSRTTSVNAAQPEQPMRAFIASLSILFAQFALGQLGCGELNAGFTWTSTPNGVQFSNGTTGTGFQTQFSWTFGDGAVSGDAQPTHLFAAPGSYEVCLTALTIYQQPNGNLLTCLDTACAVLQVGGSSDPCDGLSSEFWFGSNGGAPADIFYSAATANATHWLWSFGDGTYSDNGPQGTHSYPAPGNYELCLTVWEFLPGSQDTCSVTSCQLVTVAGDGPCDSLDAGFAALIAGLGVHFQSNVSNSQWGYHWNFGDATEGDGPSVVHNYAASGTYHACAIVWTWDPITQDTCYADHCEWVTVQGTPLCDDVHACILSSNVGNGIFLFENCSTPIANAQFHWDLGDGTQSNDVIVDHHYLQPGTYTVCLTIYWQNCVDSTCTVIVVEGGGGPCDGLHAGFVGSGVLGGIQFSNTTTGTGFQTSFSWAFGDGTGSNDAQPTHMYPEPGSYEACLTVISQYEVPGGGVITCTDSYCSLVLVQGSGNPCDGLNANFISSTAGLGVNFQNAVVNSQWSYHWNFGDGTQGDGPSPFHTFPASGPYHVCLIVWTGDPVTQDTCFADHCQWVTVQGSDPCNDLHACFEQQFVGTSGFIFTNCTTPQANAQYLWTFGDGSTSSAVSPDHHYADPGTYTVCLTAYWANCTDSICHTITVAGSTGCNSSFSTHFEWTHQGNTVVFHANSNMPVNGYVWFFNDGTNGGGDVITHLYEPPGPYEVCLAAWYWNTQTQDTCWAEFCALVDPFTGIDGFDAIPSSISIHPNPAHDRVMVSGLQGPSLLRLYSSDGRIVLQVRSTSTAHPINVSGLSAGVYVLNIDQAQGVARQRLVVE